MALATAAVLLGLLTFALAVAYVPLAWPARDFSDGWQVLLSLAAALPGVLVARRQPGNPIGWILIGLGVYGTAYTDIARYAVVDYHFHHGDLPLGPAAVLVASGLWPGQFLVLPLVILLFPDGRLPRRWQRALWAYLPPPLWSPRTSWAAPRGRWPGGRSWSTWLASWPISATRQAC